MKIENSLNVFFEKGNDKTEDALLRKHVVINQLAFQLGIHYPGHPENHKKFKKILFDWVVSNKDLFVEEFEILSC